MPGHAAMPAALRVLAQLWLREVTADDLDTLRRLPGLTETLPSSGRSDALTELAAEHQRLFGFNLPPYESVFVDPSAMLMAPATARVEARYRAAGWAPPADSRAGAPDHIGLELLAWSDWLADGRHDAARNEAARELQVRHLALWVPPLVLALRTLDPHPLYAALGELTLELVLDTLPDDALAPGADPFPDLPPPPRYEASGLDAPDGWGRPGGEGRPGVSQVSVDGGHDVGSDGTRGPDGPSGADDVAGPEHDGGPSLRRVARRLLTPRASGAYLTRAALTRAARAAELPVGMGGRERMLTGLLRLGGQYEALPTLGAALDAPLAAADAAYRGWAADYPGWGPYAAAWRERVASARETVAEVAGG